jgi:hypothetical protein
MSVKSLLLLACHEQPTSRADLSPLGPTGYAVKQVKGLCTICKVGSLIVRSTVLANCICDAHSFTISNEQAYRFQPIYLSDHSAESTNSSKYRKLNHKSSFIFIYLLHNEMTSGRIAELFSTDAANVVIELLRYSDSCAIHR